MLKTMSEKEFNAEIEKYVQKTKMNYLDSIVMYCDENELEYESVSSLLNKVIKEKIQYEAETLNLMQKTTTVRLPLWEGH